MEQILAHLVGDYLLQTNWMANEKTKRWLPAIVHGVMYTLPFVFLTQSFTALLVICITHIVIDHFRLAKYLIWASNQLGPKDTRYPQTSTGYPEQTPVWLSTWLLFIVDNTLHLLINYGSIRWL